MSHGSICDMNRLGSGIANVHRILSDEFDIIMLSKLDEVFTWKLSFKSSSTNWGRSVIVEIVSLLSLLIDT